MCLEGTFFFPGNALVVPYFNTLAHEGFTLLGEAKFTASWIFTKAKLAMLSGLSMNASYL